MSSTLELWLVCGNIVKPTWYASPLTLNGIISSSFASPSPEFLIIHGDTFFRSRNFSWNSSIHFSSVPVCNAAFYGTIILCDNLPRLLFSAQKAEEKSAYEHKAFNSSVLNFFPEAMRSRNSFSIMHWSLFVLTAFPNLASSADMNTMPLLPEPHLIYIEIQYFGFLWEIPLVTSLQTGNWPLSRNIGVFHLTSFLPTHPFFSHYMYNVKLFQFK